MNALINELTSSVDSLAISDRELFYHLLNPEDYVRFLPIARSLITAQLSHCSDETIEGLEFLPDLSRLNNRNFSNVEIPANLETSDCRELIQQFTPTALLGQCWLQGYSQAVNSHTGLATTLFRLYQTNLDENGRECDVNAYKLLMQSCGIDLPPPYTRAFRDHEELLDCAFYPALIRLCLTRCCAEFPGELIGFTAAHVLGYSIIAENSLVERILDRGISDVYQKALAKNKFKATKICQEAITVFLQSQSDKIVHNRRNLAKGFRFYVETDRVFWSTVLARINQDQSSAEKVIELFRKKAFYARGYHKAVNLNGLSLDAWFSKGLENGSAFLNALLDSEWFDSVNPDKSLFFTRIVAPGGSMFGVFTPAELQTIRTWLRDPGRLSSTTRVLNITAKRFQVESELSKVVEFPLVSTTANSKPASGELFYRLVNVDRFPDVLPAARDYVEKCLKRTQWALKLSRKPDLKLFAFSPEAFEHRIHRIYHKQLSADGPMAKKLTLDRDTWSWIIEQFAPTILVDGCWLQKINGPGMEHCPVSEPLWRIFADEIGNGDPDLNHPAIYRKLLESLDINLPQINEPQFVEYKGFIGGAFDLPVYLLALSQFPNSLLPEIIGVNLAIELSGLGNGYRQLADSLDYWGIDSTIVKVHLSIDNMASGHSAIAREVVIHYLDHIQASSGERRMQELWRRVWIGFVSMKWIPLKFVGYLAWNYLIRSAKSRIHRLSPK